MKTRLKKAVEFNLQYPATPMAVITAQDIATLNVVLGNTVQLEQIAIKDHASALMPPPPAVANLLLCTTTAQKSPALHIGVEGDHAPLTALRTLIAKGLTFVDKEGV